MKQAVDFYSPISIVTLPNSGRHIVLQALDPNLPNQINVQVASFSMSHPLYA
jgi:hypothetical protein